MFSNKLIGSIVSGLLAGFGTYVADTQLNTQIPIVEKPSKNFKKEVIVDVPEEKAPIQITETQKDKPVIEVSPATPTLHRIPDVKETDDKELFRTSREGSVGDRFKDYLIGSQHNNEVWNKKISAWKQNLGEDGGERWVTPPFRFKNKKITPNVKMLQTKCQRAYEKTRWEDAPNFQKERWNTPLQNAQYWADVWTYCARETVETPKDWPQ